MRIRVLKNRTDALTGFSEQPHAQLAADFRHRDPALRLLQRKHDLRFGELGFSWLWSDSILS